MTYASSHTSLSFRKLAALALASAFLLSGALAANPGSADARSAGSGGGQKTCKKWVMDDGGMPKCVRR